MKLYISFNPIEGEISNSPENTLTSHKSSRVELRKILEEYLKQLYWVEQELVKTIPFMIRHASSRSLIAALKLHLSITHKQASRIPRIFEILHREPESTKCQIMAGIIREAEEMIEGTTQGAVRDAAIISIAQKVKHYELEVYNKLLELNHELNYPGVSSLLNETIREEKAADAYLTQAIESSEYNEPTPDTVTIVDPEGDIREFN